MYIYNCVNRLESQRMACCPSPTKKAEELFEELFEEDPILET